MKRIFILFFMLCTLAFAGNITNVQNKGNKIVMSLKNFDKSQYQSSYDSYNRLLFLEFPKSPMTKKINTASFKNKYVESFETVDYGDGTGFFIKLNKNISYSLSSTSREFTITFNDKSFKKQYTIIIDPGHGGKDPGATGFKKYHEKDVVLAVAKYLRDELKSDFNVIMTRDSDYFVTLAQRPNIGNRAKADMFISIHANSAMTNKLYGTEVFYFSKKSSPYAERIAAFENSVGDKYGEKSSNIVQIMGELAYQKNQEISVGFARNVVNSISSGMGMKNRGIHGANFAVLRGFNGPGILIELGFINNKQDLGKLIYQSNQRKMAQQIAKAVRANYY